VIKLTGKVEPYFRDLAAGQPNAPDPEKA